MSDSEIQKKRAEKYLLGVNFFVETNRMEAFLAVYLITFKAWSEVSLGTVSLVSNIATVVFQLPVGDLVDKFRYKKGLMSVSIFIASITTMAVVWTSNFWIILVAKVFEGFAATAILPGLMSLLLGISRNKEEIPGLVIRNEVSNKCGSVLFTLGCGLIAYFLYPNIESTFYLIGSGGIIASFCVLMIPSAAIDLDRSRHLLKEDGDYNDTEKNKEQGSSNERKAKAMPYRDLLTDQNICLFAILTFIYHLANGSVQILVAQNLAVGNARTALIFTSVVMLLFFLSQASTAKLMDSALTMVSAKKLLILAHIVLPVRCCILAITITYFDNNYIICATQIFDGIGAGIYDTMIPIVISNMVADSGRFGFAYSFIITCWRVGHGCSLMLGEFVLHVTSYRVAFLTQGGISIISLILLVFCVNIPDDSTTLKKTEKEDSEEFEEEDSEEFEEEDSEEFEKEDSEEFYE